MNTTLNEVEIVQFGVSEYIALGALLFSVLATAVSFIVSSKKFELANDQRNAILNWYSESVEILIKMRMASDSSVEEKRDLLGRLSALIEVGRFYYPNVIREDGYGAEKLIAYQGRRSAVLDFLVFSYDIFTRNDSSSYSEHLLVLQKCFTSYVFTSLNTRQFKKSIKKHTGLTLDQNKTLGEFLSSAAPDLSFFMGAPDNDLHPPEKESEDSH